MIPLGKRNGCFEKWLISSNSRWGNVDLKTAKKIPNINAIKIQTFSQIFHFQCGLHLFLQQDTYGEVQASAGVHKHKSICVIWFAAVLQTIRQLLAWEKSHGQIEKQKQTYFYTMVVLLLRKWKIDADIYSQVEMKGEDIYIYISLYSGSGGLERQLHTGVNLEGDWLRVRIKLVFREVWKKISCLPKMRGRQKKDTMIL